MAFATCCVGLTIDVFRHPSSNLKELKGAKLSWSAFVMILSGLLGVIFRVIAMSIEDAALSKSLGLINSILSLVCLRRSVALKRPFSSAACFWWLTAASFLTYNFVTSNQWDSTLKLERGEIVKLGLLLFSWFDLLFGICSSGVYVPNSRRKSLCFGKSCGRACYSAALCKFSRSTTYASLSQQEDAESSNGESGEGLVNHGRGQYTQAQEPQPTPDETASMASRTLLGWIFPMLWVSIALTLRTDITLRKKNVFTWRLFSLLRC